MAGWHHRLNGHGFGWWHLVMDREAWHAVIHGVTELDMTERLSCSVYSTGLPSWLSKESAY